jgi:hypothetical protein
MILMKKPLLTAVLLAAAANMHAAVITYHADLNGSSEAPSNNSPGTGSATVKYDNVLHTMSVSVDFSGLVGNTTASHIHAATAIPDAGTAGVATVVPNFTGFPLGVKNGTYAHTFDMTLASSYNPAYVTAKGSVGAAETALADALASGKSYLNIHTQSFGGGEIRGFLHAVPEPGSTGVITGIAAALLAFVRRRKA